MYIHNCTLLFLESKYPRDGAKAIKNRIAEFPDVLIICGEVLHCKICKKVITHYVCMYVCLYVCMYCIYVKLVHEWFHTY